MHKVFQRAQQFIYLNARPLDLTRWQYHFENGSKEAILNALAYYQNEDGGFGHALEPDAWNPNSAPIQTWVATEILREIDFTDNSHPIVQGILNYLASGKDFNGKYWLNVIESNKDYPHAPWWYGTKEETGHDDYNPTACLAGFIIKYANRDSTLYKLGCKLAQSAVSTYLNQGLLNNMHTVACYIRLLQYCEEAGVTDIFDIEALCRKLKEQVIYSITKATDTWGTAYVCKPSQFITWPDSVFYPLIQEYADFECEFILQAQLPDGSWPVTWNWADYPEAWAVSRNWWKADIIIKNMLYLKGFKRI